MKTQSWAYRLLKRFGIYLSPSTYGDKSVLYLIRKGLRLWKNEILHRIARNWVMLAPLNARKLRPLLHRLRGVNIGKDVLIGIEVIFDSVYPERIHIADGAMIANNVKLIAHQRDLSAYKAPMKIRDCGYVIEDIYIGEEVLIGVGSTILAGVSIGKGAVVAAGSLVIKNVEPYTLVGGVPAKEIKKFK